MYDKPDSNMYLTSSFHSQCLKHRVLSTAIKNQVEASNQLCGNRTEIAGRCDRQQHLPHPAIQTDLQRIYKLIYINDGTTNTDLAQNGL